MTKYGNKESFCSQGCRLFTSQRSPALSALPLAPVTFATCGPASGRPSLPSSSVPSADLRRSGHEKEQQERSQSAWKELSRMYLSSTSCERNQRGLLGYQYWPQKKRLARAAGI